MRLPGHRYFGPGNSVNSGDPIDEDDRIAEEHDWLYETAKNKEEIRKADRHAISKFAKDFWKTGNYHSALGAAGLGIKHAAESIIGVQYPRFAGTMPRPIGLPPWLKPRWETMNEGQRRYAVEQYNLALVRRGLPIDHPVPLVKDVEEEAIMDFDTSLLDTAPNSPQPSTSVTAPPSPPVTRSSMAGKRKATQSSGSSTLKRHNTDDSGTSTSTFVSALSSPDNVLDEMSAGNQPGSSQGGGLNNNTDESAVIPRNKFLNTKVSFTFSKSFRISMFANAWTTMVGNKAIFGNDVRFLTSPLTEIPWNRYFWYMSPGEYASLGPGTKCTSISCELIMLNPRTAFETNESITALATFNQNRDLIISSGLETDQTVYGQNCVYTYDAKNPMLPNGIAPIGAHYYKDLSEHIYGNPSDPASVPYGLCRQPINLNSKFSYMIEPFTFATAVAGQVNHFNYADSFDQHDASQFVRKSIGRFEYSPKEAWVTRPLEVFKPYVNTIEATTTQIAGTMFPTRGSNFNDQAKYVSRTVGEPSAYINDGPSDAKQVTLLNCESRVHIMEGNRWTNNITNLQQEINNYYQLIEMSNYMRRWGESNPHGKSQPSLHVGLQPVGVLSSTVGSLAANAWQDTQVDFDVITVMTCERDIKNMVTWSETCNTTIGDERVAPTLLMAPHNASIATTDVQQNIYHATGGLYRAYNYVVDKE